MAIADDFSVNAAGDIRHISGTTNYTVLQLHRFLQDLADDAQASGDDIIDITTDTPSDRSTDNIITLLGNFNIDDDAAEYLYDGSITQSSGATVYSGLRVLGAVNNSLTALQIIQDNDLYSFTPDATSPFWGDQNTGGYNGVAASGILMRCLIKSRVSGADIDGQRIRVQARHYGDTYDFFNVTLGQGESVAAIGTTPDAQNTTAQGTVTAYSDVLNSGGTANAPTGGFQTIDLNNGNGARPYYSRWTKGAQGLQGLWEYTKDLTSNGTIKTVDGQSGNVFLGITHSWAYENEDGGPFTEREVVGWGTSFAFDGLTGNFIDGEHVTIGALGAAGKISHYSQTANLVVALEDTSITLLDDDVITGITSGATAAIDTTLLSIANNDISGGTGVLLALEDVGSTGNVFIQLLSGSAPSTAINFVGQESNANALVSTTASVVARTIPKMFAGSFTGTLIGAFGFGVLDTDLTASDTVEDLTGTSQTPPNNVTFTVSGLVDLEDRVLVGPRQDSVLYKEQANIANSIGAANTAIVIEAAAIPTDTPTSGNVRVYDDNGIYVRTPFTSYTGNTFTLDGTFSSTAATSANLFISYIDALANGETATFTSVYSTDRTLFVRVRDGGATPIKTFEAPATLGSTGGSVAAIRTSDA